MIQRIVPGSGCRYSGNRCLARFAQSIPDSLSQSHFADLTTLRLTVSP
jgi:hypothetical protein